MNSFLRISEAASLALHSMAVIAKNADRLVTTDEIATTLKASENHLSKVLQRLTHSGLLRSVRGPNGGFQTTKDPKEITLYQIYEVIEGPPSSHHCLFDLPVCDGKMCVLGGLVPNITKQIMNYLSKTTLSRLTAIVIKE